MKEEATTLFQRWLDAQNRGDFKAYEALYAQEFTGVRRSAARTVRLDRARWMKDRERMFRNPMTVEATNIEYSVGRAGVIVRFEQAWASLRYQDRGPKELVLFREKSALRIMHEEMLASNIMRSSVAQLELFAFVVNAQGHPYVVLSASPEASWRKGELKLLQKGSEESPWVARADVDASQLPPEISKRKGMNMRLVGSAGPVCEATLRDFALLSRLIPHWDDMRQWTGSSLFDDEEEKGIPWSEPAIARAIWEDTKERGQLLVGELVVTQGSCSDAIWARATAVPLPPLANAEEPSDSLREKALDAFHGLSDYRDIQHGYEEPLWPPGVKREGSWENHEGGRLAVKQFVFPSGLGLVVVHGEVPWICGDEFGANLMAFWELRGDAQAPKMVFRGTLTGSAFLPDDLMPLQAADVDGNGTPDLLFWYWPGGLQGLIRRSGQSYDQVESLRAPDRRCSC